MFIHGVYLLNDDDVVVEMYRRYGNWEPESMSTWVKHCQGNAIDVGAYTGIYSIAAAKAGASKVIAFEPNVEVYKRLLDNCGYNKVAITAMNVAAGSKKGTGKLSMRSRPLTSSGTLMGSKGKTVAVATVDSLALENVTAIKVDVERFELEVLKGAQRTIEKCHPLIICEALNQEEKDKLINWMSRYMYRHEFVDGRNIIFFPNL